MIAVNNLPEERPDLIPDYFKFLNEQIVDYRKEFNDRGFHMTVSPGLNENYTDEQAIKLIANLMNDLKMGDQPYVIYKHEDTGHTHYHIVSTLVKRIGTKAIRVNNSYYDFKTLSSSLKKHEKEFGYKTGKDPNYKSEFKKSPKFDIKKPDVRKQIASLYDSASNYSFEDRDEFEAILASMNVIAKKKKYEEEYVFYGTNYRGQRVTTGQSFIVAQGSYEAILKKASPMFRKVNQQLVKDTIDTIESALYLTNSRNGFIEYLRGHNLDVVMKPTKRGDYEEIYYVDNKNKCVFKHSEFNEILTLELFNSVITRRWETESEPSTSKTNTRRKTQNKPSQKTIKTNPIIKK